MIDVQKKYSAKNLDPRWDHQKVSYDIKNMSVDSLEDLKKIIQKYYEFYYK